MADRLRSHPLRSYASLERSREQGRDAPDPSRDRAAKLPDANTLGADQALALSRAIRAKTLVPLAPDSTPLLRADRDRA